MKYFCYVACSVLVGSMPLFATDQSDQAYIAEKGEFPGFPGSSADLPENEPDYFPTPQTDDGSSQRSTPNRRNVPAQGSSSDYEEMD